MQPTIMGLILVPVCVLFLGKPIQLLQLALLVSIFDAAASAIIGGNLGLPAATMPSLFFLIYIVLQYALGMTYAGERPIFWVMTPLLLLLAYGLISALLLPAFFDGTVLVHPQKLSPFAVGAVPLRPDGSGRNQCIYLFTNVVMALLGAVFLSRRGIPYRSIIGTYLASGYLVIFLSYWQLISRLTGFFYPEELLYSNPGVIVHFQTAGRLPRINGPFTEPAALAGFLCGIVFCSFWLWMSGARFLSPGLLCILGIVTVLFSTSTTGILAVTGGLPLLMMLAIRRQGHDGLTHTMKAVGFVSIGLLVVLLPAVLLVPSIIGDLETVFRGTINKGDSESFSERTGADLDALQALVDTYGLGVGWGSSRSSSLIPGILVNGGLAGLLLVIWFIFRVSRLLSSVPRDFRSRHGASIAVDGFAAAISGQLAAALLSGPMITSFSFFLQLACLIGAAARIHVDGRKIHPRRSDAGLPGRRAVAYASSQ